MEFNIFQWILPRAVDKKYDIFLQHKPIDFFKLEAVEKPHDNLTKVRCEKFWLEPSNFKQSFCFLLSESVLCRVVFTKKWDVKEHSPSSYFHCVIYELHELHKHFLPGELFSFRAHCRSTSALLTKVGCITLCVRWLQPCLDASQNNTLRLQRQTHTVLSRPLSSLRHNGQSQQNAELRALFRRGQVECARTWWM
jgi:hypothetical protein